MNTSTLLTLIDDSDPLVEKELLNYFTTQLSEDNLNNLELIQEKISKERTHFYQLLKKECQKSWFENCLNKLFTNNSVENIDLITDTLLTMTFLFESSNSFKKSKDWILEVSSEIKEKISFASDDAERLFILSQTLFFKYQLSGNHQSYYDPQNSDLSTLIKTRLGIPISLSMLTFLIARKAGFNCSPANIPRHFMLYFPLKVPTFMDCFNIGSLLRTDEVETFLAQINISKNPTEFIEANFLIILKRWFQNIAYIYSSRNEDEKLNELQFYIDKINSELGISDI